MKNSKRVLGIVASPRNSGNTALLVREVLRGAADKGHETELKCLGDLDINPLVECASDKRYGVAGPKDDMELIFPSLEKMNVLVFGSPIYYDHISARAKTFIDRLIYYSNEDTRERFPKNISAVTIITYEWNKPEAYNSVVEWMKGRFEHYWKMKVVASLKAWDTVKNPVANREDLLKKAYEIGKNL